MCLTRAIPISRPIHVARSPAFYQSNPWIVSLRNKKVCLHVGHVRNRSFASQVIMHFVWNTLSSHRQWPALTLAFSSGSRQMPHGLSLWASSIWKLTSSRIPWRDDTFFDRPLNSERLRLMRTWAQMRMMTAHSTIATIAYSGVHPTDPARE